MKQIIKSCVIHRNPHLYLGDSELSWFSLPGRAGERERSGGKQGRVVKRQNKHQNMDLTHLWLTHSLTSHLTHITSHWDGDGETCLFSKCREHIWDVTKIWVPACLREYSRCRHGVCVCAYQYLFTHSTKRDIQHFSHFLSLCTLITSFADKNSGLHQWLCVSVRVSLCFSKPVSLVWRSANLLLLERLITTVSLT